MSVTSEAPASYGTVDIADAFSESLAEAYPDAAVPSPGWEGTPDATTPAGVDAGLPADTDTHDDEGETVASPETQQRDAAPKKAPAKLTLTEDELRERIEAETRRARADQSKAAQRAAEVERENRRLTKTLEARELGLNQLQNTYQGTQAEMDILRERRRMDAFTEGELARETAAEQQIGQEQQQFAAQKMGVATGYYKDALIDLVAEGASLGMTRADVDALVVTLFAEDETVRDFNAEFSTAADLTTADKAARRAYRELVKAGKAAMQEKKIAALDGRETPTTQPPTKRTQAHGSFRSGNADKFESLPMKQRGHARMAESMAEDFARLGIS
jgi:hypothetical protein